MSLTAYARNVYAPQKFVDFQIVTLQATYASSGNVITRDADTSSPETTITRDTTGQFTVKFPAGTGAHLVSLYRMIAEAASGQFIDPETLSASLNDGSGQGSLTFETSTTKGTAADPADGERIFVTLFLFNH